MTEEKKEEILTEILDAVTAKEEVKEDTPLMKKKKRTRTLAIQMWERLFNKCNPLDEEDKAVLKALDTVLPNHSYVRDTQRGLKLSELSKRSLEFWATKNPEDVRAWTINIPAQIVLTVRNIKELREEGMTEDEIQELLREADEDERYPNARDPDSVDL